MGHRGELYRVEMPGEQTTMRRVWMMGHTFQRGAAHVRRTGCWLRPEPGARRRLDRGRDPTGSDYHRGPRPDAALLARWCWSRRGSLLTSPALGAVWSRASVRPCVHVQRQQGV